MLLSCRILNNVCGVNSWDLISGGLEMTEGENPTVYFVLVDESVDRFRQGYSPDGRRYVPPTGTTLSVQLDSLDDAKKITRSATQPFAGDASLWSFDLLTSDASKLKGSINLKLTLTEPSRTLYGSLKCGLLVRSL